MRIVRGCQKNLGFIGLAEVLSELVVGDVPHDLLQIRQDRLRTVIRTGQSVLVLLKIEKH